MLVNKNLPVKMTIPEVATFLIVEFVDVFLEELPCGLLSLCDFQHWIDLHLGPTMPNRIHYRLSYNDHEELH